MSGTPQYVTVLLPTLVVVNEALVRRLWTDQDPVDRTLVLKVFGKPASFTAARTAVGVWRCARRVDDRQPQSAQPPTRPSVPQIFPNENPLRRNSGMTSAVVSMAYCLSARGFSWCPS